MSTDSVLVVAVEELDAEFNTQYVNNKIDVTSGVGSAGNAAKRARKQYMLLKRTNTIMRDGMMEEVKDKTKGFKRFPIRFPKARKPHFLL
jgi:hypothetical protein